MRFTTQILARKLIYEKEGKAQKIPWGQIEINQSQPTYDWVFQFYWYCYCFANSIETILAIASILGPF